MPLNIFVFEKHSIYRGSFYYAFLLAYRQIFLQFVECDFFPLKSKNSDKIAVYFVNISRCLKRVLKYYTNKGS